MEFEWNSDGGENNVDEIFRRMEELQDERPSMPHLLHEARTLEFWNSLDAEQLHYLRTMLLAIVTADSNSTQASYQLGTADAILRMKFGLCPRCGQSHDANSEEQRGGVEAKHDYRAVCDQYQVIPEDDTGHDFTAGRVQCKLCPSIWGSLMERINSAPAGSYDCPGCTKAAVGKYP